MGMRMEKQTLYDRYCRILRRIDGAAERFHIQDIYNGIKIHRQLIQDLSALLSDGQASDGVVQELKNAVLALMRYQDAGDYMGIADVYEMQVRKLCVRALDELHQQDVWQETKDYYADNYRAAAPEIQKMLDFIKAGTEDVPQGYELVEAQVGTYTLRITLPDRQSKLLLASTANPFKAAERLAAASRSRETVRYVILGFEMGYTASAFGEQEDIVRIDVYEHDPYVIKAAFHYRDLRELLSGGRLSLIYDPMLKQFAERLSEDVRNGTAGLVLHQPSVKNIADAALRNKIQDFALQESSIRSQKRKLDGNFYRNTTERALFGVRPAESLKNIFCSRNMLLLAGGPSLEQGILRLQQTMDERILTLISQDGVRSEKISGYIPAETVLQDNEDAVLIVCVGTVLKRVLAAGIRPDYVVMTDAQENMTEQIKGVDTTDLSLVYLPTLYDEVPGQWKGCKYMALQKDYEPSERLAQEQSRMLFETGGSVSTLALDLGLRFGCRRIICMGLDLAYAGGRYHAGDRREMGVSADRIQVPSVQGGMVFTGRNLNQYRQWIERRLARRTETEMKTQLINLSCGACIEGMENKWHENFYHYT